MITDCGVFDTQAEKIMERAKQLFAEDNPDYNVTWNRPASEYPDAFFGIGFLTVKRAAIEWIDENIPQAWFRAMFV